MPTDGTHADYFSIPESELRVIAELSAAPSGIETGGDLFLGVTHGGGPAFKVVDRPRSGDGLETASGFRQSMA